MTDPAGSELVVPAAIREAARSLALSGRPVCVHASLRSFGWVAGGARTVVDALLAEGCTVLVPAFASVFRAPPPAGWWLAQNAWTPGDGASAGAAGGSAYTPDTLEIDRDLGAIPAAVVATPGRRRGAHPSDSFAAVGPLADALIREQRPLDNYAPLRALAARDGAVVLMGVGLRKMTLLHLAEQQAGRRAFRRWARGGDGRPVEVAVGSCSKGFPRLEAVLGPLGREAAAGRSRWRAFPAAATLAAATRAVRADPAVTHCGRADCERCNDAVRGGPLLDAAVAGGRARPAPG
jgi:aminoglycoside 3-N-acetyltransferase